MEQSIEWQSSLYINFIDFEKAFDSASREELWLLLRHYGIPVKIVTIIRALYEGFSTQLVHTWFVQLQTNKIQGLFKDFSRRKTSFQGPMFIQYIDIFVPFFTPKTLNSVITYFRFSNSSALVDEVSLCNDILKNDHSLAILLALTSEVKK